VVKPSNGWYSKVDDDGVVEDKKYRLKDTDNKEFWMPILVQKSFIEFVKNKYQVGSSEILKDEDIEAELATIDEDE
jgi:hypothetical protein